MALRLFKVSSKLFRWIFTFGFVWLAIEYFLSSSVGVIVQTKHFLTNTNSICPKTILYPSVISPNGKEWVGNRRTYFYSAYYDYRENATVVFSMLERRKHNLFCLSWCHNNTVEIYKPTLIIIPDSHKPRYYEAVIKCPHSGESLPKAISIVEKQCQPIVTFNIIYKKVEDKKEIHWCLSPIHAGRSIQFLEALVLHKLIGVTKATIYSENPEVSQKLKKLYWINVIDWKIPMKENEIQYHGQRSALNDCLYRNMFTAQFIDFTDLDEIFVPRRMNLTEDYSDLLWKELNTLQYSNNNKVAAFYSKSILFGTPRSIKGFASLLVTKKYDRPSDNRRKYIVLPERVSHVTVHWVFPYVNFLTTYIPDQIASLHHYRRCPDPRINCCGRDLKSDTMSANKFVLRLKNNIRKINRTLSTYL